MYRPDLAILVVINHKTTKFESNSQQSWKKACPKSCCYQSQNYKIWKQFTTIRGFIGSIFRLLSIAKLQNLKAIHNRCLTSHKTTMVVINRKTTKFESNSQPTLVFLKSIFCRYQSQNYKIWKQFTTLRSPCKKLTKLLSIAKLQNLKAIHNSMSWRLFDTSVVINRKTTKFESNSQLTAL